MKRKRYRTPKGRREQIRAANRRWRDTPRGAYATQRLNAARRAIPWEFDFESWWKLWSESGKWEQRGRVAGTYCMARRGDVGPYSPENCRITRWECNSYACAVQKFGYSPDPENVNFDDGIF